MRIAFTDRELDVMSVLWDLETATVTEVRQRLADKLAYTTVLTVLRTLEQKGSVGHTGEGRAHRYHPLVQRATAGRNALRRLLDKVFQGSPELLMTHLVSDKNLSDDELRRLRKLLEARLTGGAK
ncbi:MAG: BlaI/MecI/CopY family transcriptional regulator [Gemmatimonadales bacterium]